MVCFSNTNTSAKDDRSSITPHGFPYSTRNHDLNEALPWYGVPTPKALMIPSSLFSEAIEDDNFVTGNRQNDERQQTTESACHYSPCSPMGTKKRLSTTESILSEAIFLLEESSKYSLEEEITSTTIKH